MPQASKKRLSLFLLHAYTIEPSSRYTSGIERTERHLADVVLASASPRRRELLTSLGLHVAVVPSQYEEMPISGCAPRELACIHARGKVDAAVTTSLGLCIGADTVVDVDGEALGKPRDRREAEQMIRRLSGRSHVVHTAVSLRDLGNAERLDFAESTAVTFAELPEWLIAQYVAGGDGLDKAGAYGIQGPGAALVERIDGDFYTVMGFPLGAFVRHLPSLGYRVAVAPVAMGSMRA